MFTTLHAVACLSICLEGLLFGLYSGIFAVYLQCSSNKSRTTNLVYYVLCILYVLCAVIFVSDFLLIVLGSIFTSLQFDSLPISHRVGLVQYIANACCDFTSQCIIIYRCWIMWGKNIRIVIIPSFLAITLLASWLASAAYGQKFSDGASYCSNTLFITGLAASIAVNTLVTGMIVFRILKVTGVWPTSQTGGTKFRHIMFVVIESGMALFVIQFVRLVLSITPEPIGRVPLIIAAGDFVIALNQMLNGIAPTIILVRVQMKMSFEDDESFKEAVESLRFNNSDLNTLGSCNSTPLQGSERNEDNITPSDPITLRREPEGSSSSLVSIQESRGSGDTSIPNPEI